jgi:hypothetical protein
MTDRERAVRESMLECAEAWESQLEVVPASEPPEHVEAIRRIVRLIRIAADAKPPVALRAWAQALVEGYTGVGCDSVRVDDSLARVGPPPSPPTSTAAVVARLRANAAGLRREPKDASALPVVAFDFARAVLNDLADAIEHEAAETAPTDLAAAERAYLDACYALDDAKSRLPGGMYAWAVRDRDAAYRSLCSVRESLGGPRGVR